MFRKAITTEEPRFLKDLLEALRDSEEDLAQADALAEAVVLEAQPVRPEPALSHDELELLLDLTEMETSRAEVALLRELSAEWKEAVRLDREQTGFLSGLALAA